MPISKWDKEAICDNFSEIGVPGIMSKLSLHDLRDIFLEERGWHHTSHFYNITYFYIFKDEYQDISVDSATKFVADWKDWKKSLKDGKPLDKPFIWNYMD